ncbi:MAG: DNA polymerase III subunit alpha [Candidatus Puniceispirillaceae bacterium]
MDDVRPDSIRDATPIKGHAGFVHLRNHTAYSLSESTLRVKVLAKLAADDLQPAMAITDSFNLFGGYEFSKAMAGAGIQPIIGSVLHIRDEVGLGEIVALAQSETGYIHLSSLLSEAYMADDPTQEPHVPFDSLLAHHEGLILLSGGARKGFIGSAAAEGQIGLAEKRLTKLKAVFQNRLYIELQRHGLAEEQAAEPHLLSLADQFDLPLVATNDCHFENAEMTIPQRVLACIARGERLASTQSAHLNQHFSFKTADEMIEIFKDIPEAVENTLHLARRCAFQVEDRKPILPAFAVEAGESEADALQRLSQAGLDKRLADSRTAGLDIVDEDYKKRLEYELGIIHEMGFDGYFLIVADFIGWAKDHDIPVGPGRGSGAGSLVAYALRITDLDPLRWGLLFERFLNPERVSMPDFDIDFCQDRREEVIRYVQAHYGRDRVAQIITFGSLQARAALRDVGRVMDMPYGQVDRLAKLVPSNPANPVTLKEAIDGEPELQHLRDNDEQVADLLSVATKLEGLYRHASTHAAGLVIGDRPLPELVPVWRDPRSDMPVTQFNMKHVEQVGLVKFDFLGLKTLTVIEKTLELMRGRGIEVDINHIPLDDAKTFQMLTEGDTVGVFQLESSGMRDVLRGLKPDRFEDIIAVVALYRPGPMENIPTYISRKHGREDVVYMHPGLEPILSETYGIMIYQEQVQQAARALAGYTLGGADILRRAMGKKIKAEMDAQRAKFIEGSAEQNISAELASDIFDQIAAFAGYGFNKSHAAAYALVSYQTAWLKANHPVEFLAASMSLDSHNTEKLAVFRQDCQIHNISVLPPDINASEASFSVEVNEAGEGAVRYALGAVRNVGAEAMRFLVEERKAKGAYQDLSDFIARLPAEAANRRQLENLVKAGALDSIHDNRKQLFDQTGAILAHAEMMRREAASDQVSLFGGAAESQVNKFTLEKGADWSPQDKLAQEFEAMGLHLSAHPLDSYAGQLERLKVTPSAQIEAALAGRESRRLKLAGQLSNLSTRVSQRGNRFAFAQFSDQQGSFEVTLFSDVLALSKDVLECEHPLLLQVDARVEKDAVRLLAVRMELLEDAIAAHHAGLGVWLSDGTDLEALKSALREDGAGQAPLKLYVHDGEREVEISFENRFRLSGTLRQKLQSMQGIRQIRDI